ncbi:unnamed protein product [Rotaria sordida]|uniref:Uncharacterized protein n=1 Tax=Rotaria sordida TaxID=392033 RepID=A0A818Q779_9BILA|nr:unnamed protein product [Rotaria sordida]CAF1343326.1 unnamed protein product [Rotaria sordida]CAF3636249.1 unnamed protein product [Rotaria sordida]CAF3700712.1 unnamed protein product [Rotaria sordida]
MTQAMPPLRLIAQPKASYRERYICETDRRRNRAQRFVRADKNPYQLVYPTIEIPNEWIIKSQQSLYIRLTLVTVPNEYVHVRCVHPYPIDTEDIHVIKDPPTNSLYFPISDDELFIGQKSFQFTQKKLTKYQLKNHGPLRIFNSDEKDIQRLEDPTDSKKLIEIYDLRHSQLVFSIAVFQDNIQLPVIYDISSVFSHQMTATTTSINNDSSFRCSPQSGDWHGGEEIIMVIPKIDKRKSFTVRFVHPLINPTSSISLEFLDTKTILFYTPPCPVPLTRNNPSISIPIVVTQNGLEIARVNFVYRSSNKCLACGTNFIFKNVNSSNNNKRSFIEFNEADEIKFNELARDRTRKIDIEHSHIRNLTNTTQKSTPIKFNNQFALYDNRILERNIDSAFKLNKRTSNFFERKPTHDEILLLNPTELNQIRSSEAISKKRPKLAKQVENKGNNLLRVLASVSTDNAKETIENIATILDDEMKRYLISTLNQD